MVTMLSYENVEIFIHDIVSQVSATVWQTSAKCRQQPTHILPLNT